MRTHVDLFSGIGGFSLAAARNGVRTVLMCEIDARCRSFLTRAWPGVSIHDDVRTLGVADGERDGRRADGEGAGARGRTPAWGADSSVWLLTAGVPCQPASRAGKQRGADDDRWLWPEALRLLRHYHPTWAIFENPAGIADVGLAGILASVEAEGYEVRVHSIPACAVGAPHRRERYWIVAHTTKSNAMRAGGAVCCQERGSVADLHGINGGTVGDCLVAHTRGECGQTFRTKPEGQFGEIEAPVSGIVAHAGQAGREGAERAGTLRNEGQASRGATAECTCGLGHATGECRETRECCQQQGRAHEPAAGSTACGQGSWADFVWLPCADGKVRRAPGDSVGLVDGLHRSVLGALGNSIVPQVAEVLIRSMIQSEEEA